VNPVEFQHKAGKSHAKALLGITEKMRDKIICEPCGISVTSLGLLEIHKTGKKHIKTLAKIGLSAESVSTTPTTKTSFKPSGIGPVTSLEELKAHEAGRRHTMINGPGINLVDGTREKEVRCEPCGISVTSFQLESHEAGKKHLKTLAKINGISGLTKCEVCDVATNSPELMKTHLTGARHAEMLDRLENKKECIKAGKNPVLYIDYEANTPKMAVESRQLGVTDAGAVAVAGAEA